MKKIIFCLLFFMVGCFGDYKNDMGNGYTFVRTNADNHSIIASGSQSIIITTNVIRYAFNKDWIIGFRDLSKHSDDPSSKQSEGYFAIKTSNKDLLLGMNESDMKSFILNEELNNQKFQLCAVRNCNPVDSVLKIVQ